MPKYRVQGRLDWLEERTEYIDVVVYAADPEEALDEAAQEEWGVTLGNDVMHQWASFGEETYVEEVEDDE